MALSITEYDAFIKRYLAAAPGDVVWVPSHVTRDELESVALVRQLRDKALSEAYADWMAN